MELLFMDPVFKEAIWGGTKLRDVFDYEIPSDTTGECWAISGHANGMSHVAGGRFDGKTLGELWNEEPEIFGNYPGSQVPLLIKIIDAKDELSIQVHPDDAYAKVHENGSLGKTECWFILDCKENATLVVGHNAKSREELEQMIQEGKWKEFIREIPIKPGDFIQIDPGTVHAIKGGTLLLETQQSSDITYRVYDYDRLSNGKPRQLHITQSIDVITVPAKSAENSVVHTEKKDDAIQQLICCPYYTVYRIDVEHRVETWQDKPFVLMSVVEGEGTLNGTPLKKGDHLILPDGYGKVELQGRMQIIASTI